MQNYPVIGEYVNDRIPEIKNVARIAGGGTLGKADIAYKPESNPEDDLNRANC
jgi:hypothetical protein